MLCLLCAPARMLGLAACGTGERDSKIADLEAENAGLRVQAEELSEWMA